MDAHEPQADLTERIRQLEAELSAKVRECNAGRERDLRLRRMFEHSPDAIFVVDPGADAILDCNPKACRLLGHSREELLRARFSPLFAANGTRLKEFTQAVLEEGHGRTGELSCATKAGTAVPVEISATAMEVDGRRTLLAIVSDVSERLRLLQENQYLRTEIRVQAGFGELVGRSTAFRTLLRQIRVVGPSDASVLITGESGTGKELVARAIHERSARKDRPLVRVNCASIPGELFESEFFGHARGAFTGAIRDRVGRFELAHRGTLFLDEIGAIPVALQSKLLRVLQDRQFERVGESQTRSVDVRIVAATNTNLRQDVRDGRFREDLFYRLSVFPIDIPPLRARPEDIQPLARHFLAYFSRRLRIAPPRLTPEHVRALEAYPWPGNVRELQNVIERALILSPHGPLAFELGESGPALPALRSGAPLGLPVLRTLGDLKRQEEDLIVRTLETSGWKIYGPDGAASRLGLPPTTLASRIKALGIRRRGA